MDIQTKKLDNNYVIKPLTKQIKPSRKIDEPLCDPVADRAFMYLVVAPTGSGKSIFISSLLYRIYPKVFNKIYFCSSNVHNGEIKDKAYEKIKIKDERLFETINNDIMEYIIEDVRNDEHFEDDDYCSLVIIDDLATELKKPELIKQILRQRHAKISFIIAVQKIHNIIPTTIRSNATHWVVFKTRNEMDIQALEEISSLKKDVFRKIYDYATREPFSFLFIDMLKNPQKYYKKFDEEIIYADKV